MAEPPEPYYTPAAIRAAVKVLDQSQAISNELLAETIADAESLFERYRGVAFRVRTATAIVAGASEATVIVPHLQLVEVSSVSIDGTELTGDEIAAITVWPDGRLVRSEGWAGTQAVITYTHGFEEPPPAILRACREYVRAVALETIGNGPRNTISYTDPDSGFSYRESTPDWEAGRPTGYIAVDRALNSVPDYRVPGVA